MKYSYNWSNMILGVSVRPSLDEINIVIGRQRKEDCPPYAGGPHPINQRPN